MNPTAWGEPKGGAGLLPITIHTLLSGRVAPMHRIIDATSSHPTIAQPRMKKSILLCFLLSAPLLWAGKFTLPVIPDSQCEVNRNNALFMSQMKWIAANKTALDIPLVLHVGDIVDWDTPDHRMWKSASAGFAVLDDAKIPYAVAVGNHDGCAVGPGGSAAPGDVHANLRVTTEFNAFFPVSRFVAQQGRYEEGKSDNAWYAFKAGGLDWLVLSLEFCSRQGPVDWAKTVLSSHPDHNVIILTHYHLTAKGEISQRNAGYGDLSPQQVYDQLIKPYGNVLLVLSGHVDGTARRDDTGSSGNRIHQVLQDYQGEDGGGGYLRLLEVDTTARTISARVYSPYYNLTKNDASLFSFSNVDFVLSGRGRAR